MLNISALLCFVQVLVIVNCDYFTNIANRHNYHTEIHDQILTSDGYYLTAHRIPYGKEGATVKKRVPVLLVHGLLASSENFITIGPEDSLGFNLADSGFDVWLGNVRSVSCSRRHVKFDPDKDNEFWEFSFTEIGKYDLSAMIDYILKETSQEDLYYIGHSQGSALGMILLSELPQYNNKIRQLFALAPTLYIQNNQHPWVHHAFKIARYAHEYFGLHEVAPLRGINRIVAPIACSTPYIRYFCYLGLAGIAGYTRTEIMDYLPNLAANSPEGVSVYQFFHFSQIYKTGRFAKFDYGPDENLKRYGNSTNPDYNLKNIVTPVYLYYSKNDWYVHPQNVIKLSKELSNVAEMHYIEDEHFSHLDFTCGPTAKNEVYKKVISHMENYNKFEDKGKMLPESCDKECTEVLKK